MKRLMMTVASAAVMGIAAAPALADRGVPGTTFPEQPGANVQRGCAAVLSNPGATTAPASPTATAIVTGLIQDACPPG
jgi:hypothetical protein